MRESNGSKFYDCIIESLVVGPNPCNEQTQLTLKLRCVDDASVKWINFTLDPKYNERNVETMRAVGIDCPDELTPEAARSLEVLKLGVCYVEKLSADGKERRYLNAPGKAFVNDNRVPMGAKAGQPKARRTTRNTSTPFD